MRGTSRAVAIVAASVAVAVLAGVGRSGAAPNAAARCTTSGLVVWLDTRGSAAAGSAYYKLRFTNLSGHACTLRGYPGVSGVDLGIHRLGTPAARDNAQPPQTVTLAARASASAVLRITDALNYPRSRCRPTMAAGLRVYPPGATAARIVPFPFLACARAGPTYLSVRTLRHA